jgi:hypothetical protein
MNNEPVAWGMLDKDGGIYDSISPEEHDREEGAYTIPLYTHPVKELTDEEILQEAYYILMREQQKKHKRNEVFWCSRVYPIPNCFL